MYLKIYTFYYFYLLFQCISCSKINKSIIIVGAGASGIAAASKLLENGFENVLVLEAENRIGGRVHTVYFKDDVIELGAENCHGEKGNIVFDLVKEYNILEPNYVETNIFHSVHKQLDSRFNTKLFNLYEIIYSEDKVSEESLGNYMLSRYNKTLLEIFKDERDQKLALDGVDLIEKSVLADDGTFSWFDSSSEVEHELCEGNQELKWKKDGYKTILDILMKNYPKTKKHYPMQNKILLNKEVNKIKWSDKNKIVVKCSDKSVFEADHVIITMSLGVLKNEHTTTFYPALPKKIVKSIEKLGIAAVSKVFLYFSHKWWSDNDGGFTFMWTVTDIKNSFKEFPEGPNKKGVSWITNLMGFYHVPRNPNVLLAWFVGEFVPDIERCNNETVINGIMFALQKFIGYKYTNLTRPAELKRFNWYTNPHFRGTYSFETIQSRQFRVAQDHLLAEPLTVFDKPTLLFAGEATHPYHYATVHGAIESGFREADRIIKFYNTS